MWCMATSDGQVMLERGGVIGGTSAGASIQSSYMVRGAVEGKAGNDQLVITAAGPVIIR